MSKKIYLLATAAIILATFLSQGAMAQNKVKKVKYLDHKYNGQVNSNKIPEGEGILELYGGVDIAGHFNGNEVTNATIDVGSMKYQGDLSFDESSATLKAGGIITIFYCLSEGGRAWEYEADKGYGDHCYSIKLDKDSIVGVRDFDRDELSVNIKENRDGYIWKVLNPPSFPTRQTIKKEIYKKSYYDNGWRESHKYVFVLHKEESLIVNQYKDEQGRIWDYDENGSVKYKVVYPDGSFYQQTMQGDVWTVIYPNGNRIDVTTSGSNFITLNNGIKISAGIDTNPKEFVRLVSSKELPKLSSSFEVSFPPLMISGLSSNQTSKLIQDELLPLVPLERQNYITIYLVESFGSDYIGNNKTKFGTFRDGVYTSDKDALAKIQAEQNAKDKAGQAKVAQFTKRFGFDPTKKSMKQLVTAGRDYQLLREYIIFLNSDGDLKYHSGGKYALNLSIDRGTSKCYDLIWGNSLGGNELFNRKVLCYFWVKNGKISSVSWY